METKNKRPDNNKDIKARIAERLGKNSAAKQAWILTATGVHFDKTLFEVPINDLKRPKYHSRQPIENRIETLYKSLSNHGFLGGIFITESSCNVIDGWHRVLLWKELDHTTIPCYKIRCTEQQEKDLHLRLNTQLATFDLREFGLTNPDVNLIKDYGFTEADLKSDVISTNPITKLRQLKGNDGFKKVTVLLKSNVYERLETIKEFEKLQEWPDVLEVLIDNYEKYLPK